MAVVCKVAGDDLLVTRDGQESALSLAVPIDRLSAWLDISQDASFWDVHQTIRDQVMGPDARRIVADMEAENALDAVEVATAWSRAIGDRLGKILRVSTSGGPTEPPSVETSGSGTESDSTE